jgi:hypothetical protein
MIPIIDYYAVLFKKSLEDKAPFLGRGDDRFARDKGSAPSVHRENLPDIGRGRISHPLTFINDRHPSRRNTAQQVLTSER